MKKTVTKKTATAGTKKTATAVTKKTATAGSNQKATAGSKTVFKPLAMAALNKVIQGSDSVTVSTLVRAIEHATAVAGGIESGFIRLTQLLGADTVIRKIIEAGSAHRINKTDKKTGSITGTTWDKSPVGKKLASRCSQVKKMGEWAAAGVDIKSSKGFSDARIRAIDAGIHAVGTSKKVAPEPAKKAAKKEAPRTTEADIIGAFDSMSGKAQIALLKTLGEHAGYDMSGL